MRDDKKSWFCVFLGVRLDVATPLALGVLIEK